MEYTKFTNGEKIATVYDLDECLFAIKTRYEDDQKVLHKLTEENERLKSEQYKDEELLAMKNKVEEMRHDLHNGFPITDDEVKRINDWTHKHNVDKHCNVRMSMTYIFEPTEIGVVGIVKCSCCGEEYEFRSL